MRQARAPKGLRETRGSHMIVCVTDHHNLAFANKCTFVENKKRRVSLFESHELFMIFSCGDIMVI